jgi:hypothetical protein
VAGDEAAEADHGQVVANRLKRDAELAANDAPDADAASGQMKVRRTKQAEQTDVVADK